MSEKLYIAATEETPEVSLSFQNSVSFMSGRSLPENAHDFYRPIIYWMSSNCPKVNSPCELVMQFDYFNSSSGRFLFEMLTHIERHPKKGLFTIVWNVEKGDELMMEKGIELKSLLDLHFELREV